MAAPQDHGMGLTEAPSTPTQSTSSSSSSSDNASSDRTKNIITFVFAIAAVSLVTLSFVLRCIYIRRNNLSIRHFLNLHSTKDSRPLPITSRSRRNSRTPNRLDNFNIAPIPTTPPVAYSHRHPRQTRALDVDAAGRRLPADGESEKDILPAYGEESLGGRLPLYIELEETNREGSGYGHRSAESVHVRGEVGAEGASRGVDSHR